MGPLAAFKSKVADPHVALGHLVALITEIARSPDLIGVTVISPSPATEPKSQEALAKWPELQELSVRARDILADVDASLRAELAAQWG